jgi:hypothetical protein
LWVGVKSEKSAYHGSHRVAARASRCSRALNNSLGTCSVNWSHGHRSLNKRDSLRLRIIQRRRRVALRIDVHLGNQSIGQSGERQVHT